MAQSETAPAPCRTLRGEAPWHSSASRVHTEHHPWVTKGHGKDESFPLYTWAQRQHVALHTWIREHGPAAVLAGEVQLISPELRDALSWPSVRPSSDSPSSQIQRLILFRFAERLAGLSQNTTWPQKEKNDIHTYTSTELGVAWGRPHTNQARQLLSPYHSLHFSPPKSAHSA